MTPVAQVHPDVQEVDEKEDEEDGEEEGEGGAARAPSVRAHDLPANDRRQQRAAWRYSIIHHKLLAGWLS